MIPKPSPEAAIYCKNPTSKKCSILHGLELERSSRLAVFSLMIFVLGGCDQSSAPATPVTYRMLIGGDTGIEIGVLYPPTPGTMPNEIVGFDASLTGLAPLLSRADYTILNLETALCNSLPPPFPNKEYLHRDNPQLAASVLEYYGVDAVSLANNHAIDYGLSGLRQAIVGLDSVGIKCVGIGHGESNALRALIVELGSSDPETSVTIAFIAAFKRRKLYEKYQFYAGQDRLGVAPLEVTAIVSEIASVKERFADAIVIVSPHWGENYRWRNSKDRLVAEALIDGGADFVIGHGSHMVGEIQQHGAGIIVYSVGNFVLKTAGRYAIYEAPPFSAPIELLLHKSAHGTKVTLRIHPIVSDNLLTNYRPRPVTPSEFQRFKTVLLKKSGDAAPPMKFSVAGDEFGPFVEIER